MSRCPAHKRGDRGSSSKEFPVSPPWPQFCHVRSTLVSLDSGHRVPGHQVLQHLASKRPPSVGQEGAGPGDRGEGRGAGVRFIASVKSTHRWKGCLQMTPTRTRTHVLGKCWQDRWKKIPLVAQMICKQTHWRGLTAKDWKEVLKLKETITKIDVVKKVAILKTTEHDEIKTCKRSRVLLVVAPVQVLTPNQRCLHYFVEFQFWKNAPITHKWQRVMTRKKSRYKMCR